MSEMANLKVWMNGEVVPGERATIPFLTAGFHYGIAIFEGIRAYRTDRGGAVFRLRDHLVRFEESARILGFRELPYTIDELTAATGDVMRANGFDECYIRPLIWLAEGGWNLTIDTGRPHVAVAVWKTAVYRGDEISGRGLRANVSSFTRHHPNAMMTKAKASGNYVNSYLAKTDSHRQGFDEAIMLDPEGYVSECTGANVFLVRRGRLITPPTDTILEGITRSTVAALAADMGLSVHETRVSRDQLYVADEVFVCGTAAEILGVSEIDGRRIGAGRPGPVTTQLRETYLQIVRGRHARSADWLHWV
jgi:branched-chain amino acid aminotransferase